MTESGAVPVPPDPERPFGLYVHFPYCSARCHYCAFYFVVGRDETRAAYVDAVQGEIEAAARDPRFAGRRVSTVYFGGGTPSLLAAKDVDRLLATIGRAFPGGAPNEVSLEANPDGLDRERLAGLRAAGVRRLTLGWQSLRAEGLRILTRTHGPEDNVAALAAAREAGFENVGVDLIFGWPGQDADAWLRELGEAASLGVEHVSAYELTVEEGTRLARRRDAGRFHLADEEERARMFDGTDEVLAKHGIERYEISNFARPGFECRHNLDGWRSGDLLGVGASAASHVTNARWTNVSDVDEYVARRVAGASPARASEVLPPRTWAAEDLYLGLRTTAGIDVGERLRLLAEADRAPLRAALDAARADHLVEGESRVRLTRRGRLFADTVFDALLS
ncbi:MAG: radical SAM family heme chaperone HemW [bacterium]